jgi:hypothetical protein
MRSRRTLAGAFGLGALTLPGIAEAKKKHLHKKKKMSSSPIKNRSPAPAPGAAPASIRRIPDTSWIGSRVLQAMRLASLVVELDDLKW